ncbi:cytoplasmic protein, partial [Cystoisospora suis]
MLSGIIGGLWRSSSPSVDEARTTAGSPCTRSLSSAEDLSRARVSLYAVRGNEATELLMSASLFFEDEGESVLVVRGVSEDDSATEKDFRFPCTQIRRVRHHQPEMFQWMLSKGRGG